VLGRIVVGGVVDDAGIDDPNDATHMDSGTIAGSNGDAGSWCGNVEDLAPEEDPGTWPVDGDSHMTGPRNVSCATADQVRDPRRRQKSRVSEAQTESDQHIFPRTNQHRVPHWGAQHRV
jgi:hypothetical protein